MKRRILILVLAGMFCLTACNQGADTPTEDPKPQEEEEKDSEEEEEDDDENPDGEESGDPHQEDGQDEQNEEEVETPAETVKINVYSSNDDATAFVSKEAEIAALTPENVLAAMKAQNAVPADVQILSLEKSQEDGENVILIDFNSAFSAYISGMGSTGEYYAIGSVCNTFLDAYGCDKVKITVENATLETGHTDYPGYMSMYP